MPAKNHTARSGIYAIRHIGSGRIYVGSAVNFKDRWGKHRRHLSAGIHDNRYLQNAWNKYGPKAFTFEILEIVEDMANLIPREQDYLDRLEPWKQENGFNLCSVAGSCIGVERTPETRAKMTEIAKNRSPELVASFVQAGRDPETYAKRSESLKGRPLSEEHKAKLKAAWKPRNYTSEGLARRTLSRTGQKNSPEHRAKISAANKGRAISDEARAKISATLTGRENGPHTPEAKAKMSAAKMGNTGRLGQPLTPEHRAKIGAAHKGMTHTPETRAKISAAGMGRKASDETRAKMSASQRSRKASEETKAKMRAAWVIRRAQQGTTQQTPSDDQMNLPFAD